MSRTRNPRPVCPVPARAGSRSAHIVGDGLVQRPVLDPVAVRSDSRASRGAEQAAARIVDRVAFLGLRTTIAARRAVDRLSMQEPVVEQPEEPPEASTLTRVRCRGQQQQTAARLASPRASWWRATSSLDPATWWASSMTTRSQPASRWPGTAAHCVAAPARDSNPPARRSGFTASSEHTTWSNTRHGSTPASTGSPSGPTRTNSSPNRSAISAIHWSWTPRARRRATRCGLPRAFISVKIAPAVIVLPSPTSSQMASRTRSSARARSRVES